MIGNRPVSYTHLDVYKRQEQLQEPESEDKSMVSFVLMLRKGNKQQYKSLAVPVDSDLALNLRSQEKVSCSSCVL